MTPCCAFCELEVFAGQDYIFDDRWYHELCWWKKECARLQAEVDELKEERDSQSGDSRNAHHNIVSDDTIVYGVEGEVLGPEHFK